MDQQLSVVIPAFNAADTIGDTLGALATQLRDHDAAEILVSDNGSTDGTVAAAERWGGDLPIRIIDASRRRGQAAAMNIAAQEARGDMLVFTDADDIPLDGWMDAWLGLDPGVDFASGPVVWFAAKGNTPPAPEVVPHRLPTHMGSPYALGTNLAVRRSVLAEHGWLDETIPPAQDVELSFRLLSRGVDLTFVRGAVLGKREREGMWPVLRQYFAYGLCDPELYRRYGGTLLSRPPRIQTARSYAGLVLRLPFLTDEVERKRWAHQAGRRAGRVVGSVRSRTLYL